VVDAAQSAFSDPPDTFPAYLAQMIHAGRSLPWDGGQAR
jgi:hypothetical protein